MAASSEVVWKAGFYARWVVSELDIEIRAAKGQEKCVVVIG